MSSDVPPPPGTPPPPSPPEPPGGTPPPAPPQQDWGPPQGPTKDPSEMVNGPAIGLMVTAGIGAFGAVIGLFMSLMGAGMEGMEAFEGMEGMEWMAPLMGGAVAVILKIVSIVIAGFVFWASMQMRNLQGWGMAVTAAILAVFPCTSPCCLAGIPIGIWALVILFKPEVKAAFS